MLDWQVEDLEEQEFAQETTHKDDHDEGIPHEQVKGLRDEE
jgi:hypothetical protein